MISIHASESSAFHALHSLAFFGLFASGVWGCGSPLEPPSGKEFPLGNPALVTVKASDNGPFAQSGKPRKSPEVLFWGCSAVYEAASGLVCIPNPAKNLVLWVAEHTCDDVQLLEDYRPLRIQVRYVGGGCQIHILESSTKDVTQLVLSDRYSQSLRWTLGVNHAKSDLFQLHPRIFNRTSADLDEAVAEIWHKRSQLNDAEKTIDLLFSIAITHMRIGKMDLAISEYGQIIEHAAKAGYKSVAFEAAYRRAFLLRDHGLLPEARAEIMAAEAWFVPGHARARMTWALEYGFILRDEERLPEAIEKFRLALVDAERLDDREIMRLATPTLAGILAAADRAEEAQNLLSNSTDLLDGVSECAKAGFLTSESWAGLALAENAEQLGKPLKLGQQLLKKVLERALESREKCQDNPALANLYSAMAQVAFHEHRFADAQTYREKALKVPGIDPIDRMELLDFEARMALLAGRAADSLYSYQKLDDATREYATNRRQFECKVAIGMTESLHSLGQKNLQPWLGKLKTCINQKTKGILPADIKNWTRRAQAVGL